MYMRIVQMKVNPEELPGFRKLYEERVVPALKALKGCISANLMHSEDDPDEYLSLTLWEQQENAEAYEQSGLFAELVDETRPFLSESSEWKMQLSKDMELEYKPVEQEPVVKSLPVILEPGEKAPPDMDAGPMHLRIVSMKIQPQKEHEFQQLFKDEIIPALLEVQGCYYAYLVENIKEPNEFYSVNLWRSPEDAAAYERSGLFEKLVKRIEHTFSGLYQWKMQLEKNKQARVITSDEVGLDHYDFITGEKF